VCGRSSFRDILRGVEEGEPPSEHIKFGRESLKIDAWYKKCQYDWFCKVSSVRLRERRFFFFFLI
jgi:hypothetical protein